MFIGLGDTDEHAHHGDRERYLDSLRADDAFLAELETRVSDRTALFVTADHGRNASFRDHGAAWSESGRVWLVVKGASAARGLIDDDGLHLRDIAPTIRCLLGGASDPHPHAGHPIASLCARE